MSMFPLAQHTTCGTIYLVLQEVAVPTETHGVNGV